MKIFDMGKVAISLIVTAIAVGVVTVIVFLSKGMGDKGIENSSRLITVDQATFKQDLNGKISGAKVKSLLEEYNNGGIHTLTVLKVESSPDDPTAQRSFYSCNGIDDPTSENFFTDDVMFEGETIKNDSGVVIAVQFVQEGCDPVDYDDDEAEAVGFGLEHQVMQAQVDYWESSVNCTTAIKECLTAYYQYTQALAKEIASELNRLARQTTMSNIDAKDTAASTEILEKMTAFYKQLAKIINEDWIPNKWFDALLFNKIEGGFDPDEPSDFDDDDDDWGDDDDASWEEDPDAPDFDDSTTEDSDENSDDSNDNSYSKDDDLANKTEGGNKVDDDVLDDLFNDLDPKPSASSEPSASDEPSASSGPSTSDEPSSSSGPGSSEPSTSSSSEPGSNEPSTPNEPSSGSANETGEVPIQPPTL